MQAGLEGVAQEIRQVCVRPPRSWGLGQAPHHQPVAGAGQDNPKHIVGFNTVLSSDQHQSPSRVANLSYKAGQISHLSARVCVGRVETGGTCCLLELPKHSLHFLPLLSPSGASSSPPARLGSQSISQPQPTSGRGNSWASTRVFHQGQTMPCGGLTSLGSCPCGCPEC